MRYSLQNFVNAIERTGVSLRSAAMIGNALLQDIGLITANDNSMVIDKSKITREKIILHEKLKTKHNIEVLLKGVYFDGRKDKTKIRLKKNNKYYMKEVSEEHITLLQEPGERYLTHLTPDSGSSNDLSKEIYEFLIQSEVEISKLGKCFQKFIKK